MDCVACQLMDQLYHRLAWWSWIAECKDSRSVVYIHSDHENCKRRQNCWCIEQEHLVALSAMCGRLRSFHLWSCWPNVCDTDNIRPSEYDRKNWDLLFGCKIWIPTRTSAIACVIVNCKKIDRISHLKTAWMIQLSAYSFAEYPTTIEVFDGNRYLQRPSFLINLKIYNFGKCFEQIKIDNWIARQDQQHD